MSVSPEMMQALQQEVADEANAPSPEETNMERVSDNVNLAAKMDEQDRLTLGMELCKQIEEDDSTREEWKDNNQEYLKLATQVADMKSFPWPDASNVKYPLITTASMQFQSRCYKALLSGSRPVRARVVGNDKLGMKKERANRISEHMSYQLLEELPNWEEHMDTLCLVVPICGNAYKKTYWDGNSIRSDLVLPQDLIVNFYSTSIDEAPRKTHVMPLSRNELVSNIRSGFYVNVDLEKLVSSDEDLLDDEDALLDGQGLTKPQDTTDSAVPYKIYECHTYLDMDNDGYDEPYIVTIIEQTQEVVRISPRFSAKDVEFNVNNEVVRIKANEHFTNFRFLPDPRSGVYGLGFGHILGPINEATNTLINQLIDAGTLAVMPSGWIARGARIEAGPQYFKPGEWKLMNTMADDLRKAIYPLPIKEPSAVLFQLLGMFIEAGKSLASVTDMMQGKSPGQNQPFSTTSAMLEQGMAVYSTIFKRMHRAFKKELAKIFRLNRLYLQPEVYFSVIDPETGQDVPLQVSKTDYERDTTDVVPNSDPENVSSFQKLADAELLMGLMQTGMINPQEAIRRILEARNIENMQALLELPPPQPNPEHVLKEKELAIRQQEVAGQQQIDQFKAQYQAARDQAASVAKLAEAQMAKANMQLTAQQQEFQQMLDAAKLELENYKAGLEEKKIEADKLKAEKEEREKNTIKASDLKKK